MHFFNRHTLLNGFTLIEMLVAITILLLLLGGSMAAFSNFNDRRVVEETAKQVQQLFITAQQKTSVQEVPPDCLNTHSLDGYRISYSNPKFILYAICLTKDDPPVTEYKVVGKEVSIPTGMIVNTTTSINFLTRERGVSATATYTFQGSSANYRFSVNPGGTITSVEKY